MAREGKRRSESCSGGRCERKEPRKAREILYTTTSLRRTGLTYSYSMDELSYVEDYAPQPLADPLAFLNEQPLPSILAPPALATTQQQSFSQQESVIPSGNERLGGEQMVTGAGVEIPATETSESWGGTAAFSSANQYTFGSNDGKSPFPSLPLCPS